MNPTAQVSGAIPINSYLQADMASQPTTATPPATPVGKQPSFWERILPTAGGILGGIAGGAADVASLGALAPLINPVTGAAAGGALGKAGENLATKQNVGSGVLGSAAENAVGAIGGGILGKGTSAVLGKVISPISNKLSTAALQGQFKGTLDAGTAKVLSDMGITDARQIADISPLVTQGGGALSTGVKQALATSADNGQGINVTGLDTIAKNMLAEHGVQPRTIDTVGSNLTNSINNMVNPEDITKAVNKQGLPTYAYASGSLENALPENVFKQSQKMDQLASQSYNKAYDKMGSVTNTEELAKGQTYSKLADELESRAFGTTPGSTPLALTDDAKKSIIDQLAPVKDVNESVYNHYVGTVQNANTVQELRPLQSSMVNASKALESTQRIAAKGGGLSGSDIARGAAGMATSPVKAAAGMVLNSPAADRAAASTMSNLSNVTGKASASKILPLLARTAAISATNLPNDVGEPTNAESGNIGAGTAQGAAMQPDILSSINQSPLIQAYNTALTGGFGIGSPYTSALTTLAPQAQKLETAAPLLQQLVGGLGAAGGTQGPLAGGLTKLTGIIPGTAANTYNREQGSVASIIAQLLGISPQSAMGALPQLTQAPGTAAPQLSTLAGVLGATQ
jgi:hypothetical protein